MILSTTSLADWIGFHQAYSGRDGLNGITFAVTATIDGYRLAAESVSPLIDVNSEFSDSAT